MHEDDVFDLLTEIDESGSSTKAEQFRALAEQLTQGEHGRATFLVAAGQHFQMRREYDAARECFEAAGEDGGESATEPIANMHSLALATGDRQHADVLHDQLRAMARRDELGADTCLLVGETFESHDLLPEAARWFTIPLSWVEPDDDEELDYFCLIARRRVREVLGKAPDRYDRAAEHALERQRQRHRE